MHFTDRLIDAIREKGTPAVVGLDPRVEQIPESLKTGLTDGGDRAEAAAQVILDFNRRVIDVVHSLVPAVKPQIAFYELYGPHGLRAYWETVAYAQSKGLLVIGDVKRSDIGSTAEAYAKAHLGGAAVGLPAADAVTINPYLGWDGIKPFVDACQSGGQGLFILVRTSNPSAKEIQDLRCEGVELFVKVAELVKGWGDSLRGNRGYSCVGAVVGATYPQEAERLRQLMPHTYFLVPGYGAQGGTAADVAKCFNADGLGAVVNSSRGITFAHSCAPWSERYGETKWEQAVEAALVDMIEDLRATIPPIA